ncbi:MAG: type II toxin-antitoxin system ParD family antitoxin [Verrucomicrobia bacterium]|nr:type II toxin-antitoxin system ParD family antitoxin [Verrucomicrobiota bacterium]
MHISLTQELEHLIRLKVDSGVYNSASEVVGESLRLMRERDAMHSRLQAEIDLGWNQLQRGEGTSVNSEDEFQTLANGTR